MGGVRARKTRRARNIKILKNERKKKKLVKPAIGNEVLKQHWDEKKTLQQNMKDLGLAYDSNNAIPIENIRKINKKQRMKADDVEETMETEHEVNPAVITEFEKQAANGKQTERHISPDEAKFVMTFMKKHGTNYKKMSRDKLNTLQHTAKVIQRKCEALLKSTLYEKYQALYPELSVVADMEMS